MVGGGVMVMQKGKRDPHTDEEARGRREGRLRTSKNRSNLQSERTVANKLWR
jgi:hypothetical protein